MTTVPSPRVWADNDALSTTNLNTGIKDPIAFLLSPPHAMLRRTTAQSLLNATLTPIQFTTEDVDTDVDAVGGHDNSTNPSRYTARYPGWYEIGGGIGYASNSTGTRIAELYVNGVQLGGAGTIIPAVNGFPTAVPVRTTLVYLNAGDYVEMVGYQNSGGALNTDTATDSQPSMTVTWKSN